MLSRRDFLVTLVLTPLASACNSSTGGGVTPAPACDGAGETSTVAQEHTHTVGVSAALLASPPAAGATFKTSPNEGHLHDVVFTQAQLMSIAQGGTVTVTTTRVNEHTHDFAVTTAADQPSPIPTPTTTPFY
jgi:hypothetical protein